MEGNPLTYIWSASGALGEEDIYEETGTDNGSTVASVK